MSKYFKKADIILLVVILALSIAGFIMLRSSSNDDSIIEVSIAGEVTETHPLNVDAKYDIASEYGYNTILVENGQVKVIDADCANKDCMNFGAISQEGQIILCLPHKLSVRIVGGGGDLDAVSY